MNDDSAKVACIHCGVLILPSTAERWSGLCGRCDRRRKQGFPPPSMTLQITPKQRKHFMTIAAAIFGNDEVAISDCESAFNDWKAFYERQASKLYDPRDGAPIPIELLIDVATSHGHLFEADWREFPSDVLQGVAELKRLHGLAVKWPSVDVNDDESLEPFLSELASSLSLQSLTLMMINKFSDSYPLCVASLDAAESALQAANALGENYVIHCIQFAE